MRMIHSCIKLIFYDSIMTLSDLAEFVNNISAKPRPRTMGGEGETGRRPLVGLGEVISSVVGSFFAFTIDF